MLSRSRGTWLFLVVIFVASYVFFSQRRVPYGSLTTTQRFLVFSGIFVVIFLLSFARLTWQAGAVRKSATLLGAGKSLEALEALEERGAKERPYGKVLTGLASLELWRIQASVDALEAALADRQTHRTYKFIVPSIRHTQALGLAILGRTDEARRALAAVPAQSINPGLAQLTEAVLLVRAGDFERALPLATSAPVKQLAGTPGELGRALVTMATERLTHQPQRVDRVAFFGEASSDQLRAAWPELVDFVERPTT